MLREKTKSRSIVTYTELMQIKNSILGGFNSKLTLLVVIPHDPLKKSPKAFSLKNYVHTARQTAPERRFLNTIN